MEPINFTAVSLYDEFWLWLAVEILLRCFFCRYIAETNFIVMQANEDGNCYSYDARKLDEAKCVHKDHVSAV